MINGDHALLPAGYQFSVSVSVPQADHPGTWWRTQVNIPGLFKAHSTVLLPQGLQGQRLT